MKMFATDKTGHAEVVEVESIRCRSVTTNFWMSSGESQSHYFEPARSRCWNAISLRDFFIIRPRKERRPKLPKINR